MFNSFNRKRDKELSRKQFSSLLRALRVNLTQQQVSLLLSRFVLERRPAPRQRERNENERESDTCISWYDFEILCGVCSDLIQQIGSGSNVPRHRTGDVHVSSVAAVLGKVRRFFAERVLMRGEAGDEELNVFDDMDRDGDGLLSHVEFEASAQQSFLD